MRLPPLLLQLLANRIARLAGPARRVGVRVARARCHATAAVRSPVVGALDAALRPGPAALGAQLVAALARHFCDVIGKHERLDRMEDRKLSTFGFV